MENQQSRKAQPALAEGHLRRSSRKELYPEEQTRAQVFAKRNAAFRHQLGVADDAEPATAAKVARWFFARNGSASGPLVYGETVAIGNGKKPSFIRYKQRTVGINLDWSDPPVFEWKLVGGPAGVKIDPNQYLAIYNEKAEEFLVFFDRTVGGDIGWPSSQTWGDQLTAELVEYAKKEALKALLDAAA